MLINKKSLTIEQLEEQANARLIASAPELLAALKGLLAQAENGLDQRVTHEGLINCDVLAKARLALAHAEGRG